MNIACSLLFSGLIYFSTYKFSTHTFRNILVYWFIRFSPCTVPQEEKFAALIWFIEYFPLMKPLKLEHIMHEPFMGNYIVLCKMAVTLVLLLWKNNVNFGNRHGLPNWKWCPKFWWVCTFHCHFVLCLNHVTFDHVLC